MTKTTKPKVKAFIKITPKPNYKMTEKQKDELLALLDKEGIKYYVVRDIEK